MALQPLRELAISLPFRIDSLGKVAATGSQDKIWADKVRGVIGTIPGQRVYRPDFGSAAGGRVYDSEEDVLASLEPQIRTAFKKHLPLLSIDSVSVDLDPVSRVITAEINYIVPSGADFVVRIGIATLNGTDPISEETQWQIR